MGRFRVLIIDDDPFIREHVASALDAAGYEPIAVADLAAGLDLARERRPDLVLLDTVDGPVRDEDFIRSFRRLPGATAPVVLFTAWPHATEHAARIHADDILSKPLDVAALSHLVSGYAAR